MSGRLTDPLNLNLFFLLPQACVDLFGSRLPVVDEHTPSVYMSRADSSPKNAPMPSCTAHRERVIHPILPVWLQ